MSQLPSPRPPAGSLDEQARVDRACDDFEARVKAGDRPRIEDFLHGVVGPERQALLGELLQMEFEYRGRQGEGVQPGDYLGRFPDDSELVGRVLAAAPWPPLRPAGAGAVGMAALHAGARPLPDYELIRKLGEGGFGEAWHARGPGGHDIALKFIRLDAGHGEREARSLELMKAIRHPNLVSLFGHWQRDNLLILAMELCDRSLQDRLKEALGQQLPGLPLKELLRYLRDAARGLDALNDQNVQHCDIKPGNLLLLQKGVKVADFGLAKVLERALASHSGVMTAAYSPPESFRGAITKKSDQYSLAVTYYHLRTGRLLFVGNQQQMMYGHLHQEPNLDDLPKVEQAALARALAKEPEKRWANCTKFVHELRRAPSAAPFKPPPPNPETLPAPRQNVERSAEEVALLAQPTLIPPPALKPTPELALIGGNKAATEPMTEPIAERSRPGSNKGPKKGFSAAGIGVVTIVLAGTIGLLALGMTALLNTGRPGERVSSLFRPSPTTPKAPVDTNERMPNPPTPEAPVDTNERKPWLPPGDYVKPTPLKAPFDSNMANAAQAAWAKHLGRKVEEEIDLGGGVKLVLVLIPPGSFTMGSPKDEKVRVDDEEAHAVTLTKPYYLGKYAVTQGQYERVAGKNPSNFAAGGDDKEKVNGIDTAGFPVEMVSWEDADVFCKAVGTKVAWGKVGLPSEAQREYACRAGTETPFWFGSELNGKQANCDGNSPYGTEAKGPSLERTCAVGGYGGNGFGLYDMHGNVWEWCLDWYGPYEGLGEKDPVRVDKDTIERRVLRGGSWDGHPRYCRAAFRFWIPPADRYRFIGFRVCVLLD